MIFVVALVVLACLMIPAIGLRFGSGRPDQAAFKARAVRVDAAVSAVLAAAYLVEIVLFDPKSSLLAQVFLMLLQFPLAYLAKRFGYQIAFFLQRDNWSRPKR